MSQNEKVQSAGWVDLFESGSMFMRRSCIIETEDQRDRYFNV